MDSINITPKLELQAVEARQINTWEELNRHKYLISGTSGHNIINNNNSYSKLYTTTPSTGEPNNHSQLINNNRVAPPEQQRQQANICSGEINRCGDHLEQQKCDQVNRHNEANQSMRVQSYQNDLLNQLERTGVKYCDNSCYASPNTQNQPTSETSFQLLQEEAQPAITSAPARSPRAKWTVPDPYPQFHDDTGAQYTTSRVDIQYIKEHRYRSDRQSLKFLVKARKDARAPRWLELDLIR